MSNDNNAMRLARLSLANDSPVQIVRADLQENNSREDAERFQQYGFAAAPSEGEGVTLEIGGLTIVMSFDRLADRPGLELNEVIMWHKDGHYVKLDNAGQVHAKCQKAYIEAPESEFTGNVKINGTLHVVGAASLDSTMSAQGVVSSQADMKIGNMSLSNHGHTNVEHGPDTSGGPVSL